MGVRTWLRQNMLGLQSDARAFAAGSIGFRTLVTGRGPVGNPPPITRDELAALRPALRPFATMIGVRNDRLGRNWSIRRIGG